MPFRFQKRIKLAKGVSLNVGKKGVSSIRVGKRGAGVSTGRRGTRVTAGLPGTGMSANKKVGAGCLLPLAVLALIVNAVIIAS
jgi:hypothetical protein